MQGNMFTGSGDYDMGIFGDRGGNISLFTTESTLDFTWMKENQVVC